MPARLLESLWNPFLIRTQHMWQILLRHKNKISSHSFHIPIFYTSYFYLNLTSSSHNSSHLVELNKKNKFLGFIISFFSLGKSLGSWKLVNRELFLPPSRYTRIKLNLPIFFCGPHSICSYVHKHVKFLFRYLKEITYMDWKGCRTSDTVK